MVTKKSAEVVVGLVGPCTSGKSSLKTRLEPYGFAVHHIAQEHSFLPDMWRRIVNPDILVFLAVSYPVTLTRRRTDWTEADYLEQLRRLQHARTHSDLELDTDQFSEIEVHEKVLEYLNSVIRKGN